jgi:hypothetical protein
MNYWYGEDTKMGKLIPYIVLIVIITSCNRGIWLSSNLYRPKHPKFKIRKTDFKSNSLINNFYQYVSSKKYMSDSKERVLYNFTGFYSDGRMIGNSFNDLELLQIHNTNSFSTASNIGYYTTDGEKIKFEYFVQGDGGQYVTRQGIIKKDTIILSETFSLLFKKEVRNDTLIKSDYPLK